MTLDPFEDDPPPKTNDGFKRGLCIGALLGCFGLGIVSVVGSLIVYGVLSETGEIPATKVVTGAELSAGAHQMLIDEGVVDKGETIHHFYSAGLLSYREDGSFYTDRRVISYWEEGDQIQVSEASYDEIERIEPEFTESIWDDTVVWVYGTMDGEEWSMNLYVSNENELDHIFVDGLMETWERER